MMAAAGRRDLRVVIEDTRQALDGFEQKLNAFSAVLDELEAETQRQREGREGWP